MKPPIRTKIENGHAENCYSVKSVEDGSWDSAWLSENRVLYRNHVGNKNGKQSNNHRWLVFRCNCTYCNALILVNENDLIARIPKQ